MVVVKNVSNYDGFRTWRYQYATDMPSTTGGPPCFGEICKFAHFFLNLTLFALNECLIDAAAPSSKSVPHIVVKHYTGVASTIAAVSPSFLFPNSSLPYLFNPSSATGVPSTPKRSFRFPMGGRTKLSVVFVHENDRTKVLLQSFNTHDYHLNEKASNWISCRR